MAGPGLVEVKAGEKKAKAHNGDLEIVLIKKSGEQVRAGSLEQARKKFEQGDRLQVGVKSNLSGVVLSNPNFSVFTANPAEIRQRGQVPAQQIDNFPGNRLQFFGLEWADATLMQSECDVRYSIDSSGTPSMPRYANHDFCENVAKIDGHLVYRPQNRTYFTGGFDDIVRSGGNVDMHLYRNAASMRLTSYYFENIPPFSQDDPLGSNGVITILMSRLRAAGVQYPEDMVNTVSVPSDERHPNELPTKFIATVARYADSTGAFLNDTEHFTGYHGTYRPGPLQSAYYVGFLDSSTYPSQTLSDLVFTAFSVIQTRAERQSNDILGAGVTYGNFIDHGNYNWEITAGCFRGDRLVGARTGVEGRENKPRMNVRIKRERTTVMAAPNPFNVSTNIVVSGVPGAQAHVKIFNIDGQQIWQKSEMIPSNGELSLRFDSKGLPSGAYNVMVQAGEDTQMARIILVK